MGHGSTPRACRALARISAEREASTRAQKAASPRASSKADSSRTRAASDAKGSACGLRAPSRSSTRSTSALRCCLEKLGTLLMRDRAEASTTPGSLSSSASRAAVSALAVSVAASAEAMRRRNPGAVCGMSSCNARVPRAPNRATEYAAVSASSPPRLTRSTKRPSAFSMRSLPIALIARLRTPPSGSSP